MNGDNGVQLYSAHARELKFTQQHKIRKFIEQDCVQYVPVSEGGGYWIVHHIPGYNSTDYEVRQNRQFEFECNCQGWVTKHRMYQREPNGNNSPSCSHVGAVFEWLKRHNIERKRETVMIKLTEFCMTGARA